MALYGSLSEMSEDSEAIVVGTVTDQEVVRDVTEEDDFTVSSIAVTRVVQGSDVDAGDVVDVRQAGSDEQQTDVGLLGTDRVYLLYLAPSGLSGDLASQYYVTGADAGIYEAVPDASPGPTLLTTVSGASSAEAEDVGFVRVEADTGDTLPATITLREAEDQAR